MAAFGTDFGQKVDLTASIRNILRNYPEGTAILKELVQNADDAGARSISFTLDCRSHDTGSLANASLAQFQGPALHVYNDAAFTEEDFISIQRIGDSMKSSSEGKSKIGRFGIGFNAVYHWTDLPSFISTNYLVMLDPQARFLPDVNPSNPGKIVDWYGNRSVLDLFRDQFTPYRGYGLDGAHPFPGTLFRLPLRTAHQSESSLLSKRALSVSEAKNLLEALRQEASAMLLFLKNVESIEICQWNVGEEEREVIFKCNIMNISLELQNKRAFVAVMIPKDKTKIGGSISAVDYSLQINCQSGDRRRHPFGDLVAGSECQEYREKWEVCNQMGGEGSNRIAGDPLNALLRLLPWGGVAVCLSTGMPPNTTNSTNISNINNSANIASIKDERPGLAYCFLPLPIQTGLPVMINGFFELSSNRRDIWQSGQGGSGGEMTGDGRTRAEWNLSLMRDVISPSYVRVLLRARDVLGFTEEYQSLFPSLVAAPWSIVVESTLSRCRNEKLLFVGSLTPPNTTGNNTDNSSNIKINNSFSNTWVSCNQAVLLPDSTLDPRSSADRRSTSPRSLPLTAAQEESLSIFLLETGQSYVRCASVLNKTLLSFKSCERIAVPSFVRSVFRGGDATKIISSYVPTSSACSSFLLQYCLSDLDPSSHHDCMQLDTLPLLPLLNGTVGTIKIFSSAHAVAMTELCGMGYSLPRAVWALTQRSFDVFAACDLISSTTTEEFSGIEGSSSYDRMYGVYVLANTEVASIFCGAGNMLVDCSSLSHIVNEFLGNECVQRVSNMRVFKAGLIPDLLRMILPKESFSGGSVSIMGDNNNGASASSFSLLPSTTKRTTSTPSSTSSPSSSPSITVTITPERFKALITFLPAFWAYVMNSDEYISSFADGGAIVPFLSPSLLPPPSSTSAITSNVISALTDTTTDSTLPPTVGKDHYTIINISPLSRMSSLITPKKGDLTLPPDILVILQTIGLHIVDFSLLPQCDGLIARTFWEYVHSPNRSGLLTAADAVMRNNYVRNMAVRGGDTQAVETLIGEQKLVFRLYLSSCEPVSNLSEPDCAIIRKLSIFSSFKDPEDYFPMATRSGISEERRKISNTSSSSSASFSSSTSSTSSASSSSSLSRDASSLWDASRYKPFVTIIFTDSSSSGKVTGIFPSEILPPHFLKYENQSDLSLLKKLGVKIMSKSEFFRVEFLPIVTELMRIYPEQTEKMLVYMLEELKILTTEDNKFLSLLEEIPFLPAYSTPNTGFPPNSTPSTGFLPPKLYKPSELFDPQCSELLTLLDPSRFPSMTFRSEHLRVALRTVGLAYSLEWPDIISCAMSIAHAGRESERKQSEYNENREKDGKEGKEGKEGNEGRGGKSQTVFASEGLPSTPGDSDTARRGIALFRFLDNNISRLLDEKKAKGPQGLSLLYGIRSLFTDTPAQMAKTLTAVPVDRYLQQLVTIPWIPVSVTPSKPYMPWPTDDTSSSSSPSLSSSYEYENNPLNNNNNNYNSNNTNRTAEPNKADTTDTHSRKIQVLSHFAAAVDCRPMTDAWLCSATKRLLDDSSASSVDSMLGPSSLVLSSQLLEVLGWMMPLDARTLAIQLREVARSYSELVGDSQLNKDTDVNNIATDNGDNNALITTGTITAQSQLFQEAREHITILIPLLYQRVNAVCVGGVGEGRDGTLLEELQGQKWIWVGDSFVSPNRVALTSVVNATPYLYQLPQDLRVYQKLLGSFGIKRAFTPRDYVQVLREMFDSSSVKPDGPNNGPNIGGKVGMKEGIKGGEKEEVTNPLSDSKIDLAVSLVTLLSAEGDINANVHIIYAPDSTGRLAHSISLINDDVPWLSGAEHAATRVGCRFIHPNISSLVAQKLGVKSLRLTLTSRSLDQNFFSSAAANDEMEAFGQAESLTARLKGILDLYPEGTSVFSELIQNADDAGATKMMIMLDEKTYPSESLLDSKMAPLQGPSLIVANDAVFTEADFKSLARIGQGSKLEKLASTGRFGLGFSSTYHLTDTPSFVSGEHLVVFDPHCSFAPGVTLNQPGLRIRFKGSALPNSFKDQFAPFLHFGCDFKDTYNGTLFRFPLRTTSLARRSEISKKSSQISDIQKDIDILVTQLANHLIFLRSVKSIEIYSCKNGQKPFLIHVATSSTSGREGQGDLSLLQYFDKKVNASPRDVFYEKLLSTPEKRLPTLSYKVNVQVDSYSVPVVVVRSSGEGDGASEKQVGEVGVIGEGERQREGERERAVEGVVTVHAKSIPPPPTPPPSETVEYLVVTGLMGGEARRVACEETSRHLKLVSLGAVAACITRTGRFQNLDPGSGPGFGPCFPPTAGQAFCFLPLPVRTKLPVHANAYWELSANRRDIWRGDDTTGEARLRSDWNKYVMHDVIAPLYALLLVKACTHLQSLPDSPSPSSILPLNPTATTTSATGAITATGDSSIGSSSTRSSPYSILSLFPCPAPPDYWGSIPTSLFPLLADQRILFSHSNGGCYLSLKQSIILESNMSTSAFLSTHSAAAYGTAKNSLQNNENKTQSPQSPQSAHTETARLYGGTNSTERLERLLLLERLPVAVVPTEVFSALVGSGCVRDRVTPGYVRGLFSVHQGGNVKHPSISASVGVSVGGVSGGSVGGDGGVVVSQEEALSNALFLLQYSFQDISNDNRGRKGDRDRDDSAPFTALHGLSILPLEDGTMGTIEEPMGAPLYLVNNSERRLLKRAGGQIVIADSQLGPSVTSILKDPSFPQHCNVRPLTPIDTLKVLRTFLPISWFDSSVSTVINRESAVSDEWLEWLWAYILEEKSISLFEGVLPLLPILSPGSLPSGRYLVKVSPLVPVLHMSFSELPSAAQDVLSKVGVYILDSSVIGGSAYSQEIGRLVSDASPKGLLIAICVVSRNKQFKDIVVNWSVDMKRATRDLMLDNIIAKLDIKHITTEEKEILFSIPVWETHTNGTNPHTPHTNTNTNTPHTQTPHTPRPPKFSPINPITIPDSNEVVQEVEVTYLQIPPRGVSVQLLGEEFLVLRGDADRGLYDKLGLQEPSKGLFFAINILPHINKMGSNTGSLAPNSGSSPPEGLEGLDSFADTLAVEMLKGLEHLEVEQPGISKILSTSHLFRSQSGALCSPISLYDPHVKYLQSLLPQEVFPSPLFSDPSLLRSLRILGMHSSITAEGVVTAALNVQMSWKRLSAPFSSSSSSFSSSTSVPSAVVPSTSTAHTASSAISAMSVAVSDAPQDDHHMNGNGSGSAGGGSARGDSARGDSARGESVAQVVERASGLLQYVEANIETLLLSVDPSGLLRVKERVRERKDREGREEEEVKRRSTESGRDGGEEDESLQQLEELLGGEWGQALRDISWIPVLTAAPRGSTSFLPWPDTNVLSVLASPSQCVSMRDMWTCSSTRRVCSFDVKDEMVQTLLGWDKPVSGRTISLQLLSMKDTLAKSSSHPDSSRHYLVEAYYSMVPKVLSALSGAMVRERRREVDIWLGVLRNKSIVWVPSTCSFESSSRVAFSSPLSGDTEPFLFIVKRDMLQFTPLLKALGVRDSFGPQDFALLTREMCNRYVDTPLPAPKMELSLTVLKYLSRALKGEGEDDGEGGDGVGGGVGGGGEVDEKSGDRGDNGEEDDDSDDEYDVTETIESAGARAITASSSKDENDRKSEKREKRERREKKVPMVKKEKEIKSKLVDFLPIFMPDRNCLLFSSSFLTVDDAPWISSALSQQSSTVKFVHRSIDAADALSLGAKSLRGLLFSGDDILCPNPSQLNALLLHDKVNEVIRDLVAMADTLHATGVHVLFDQRNHPTESLMHPGLAIAQGPSLVVYIEGTSLSSEQVCQHLTPPDILPPYYEDEKKARGYGFPGGNFEGLGGFNTSTHGMKENDEGNQLKEEKLYPRTGGKRLSTAFAITDCLQIITGREYFIFDPCGLHLFSREEEKATTASSKPDKKSGFTPTPRAQRCFLVGSNKSNVRSSGDEDVLTRFPDQFSPFLSLPFKLDSSLIKEGKLNGTLIRMSLRASPSLLSPVITSEGDVKAAMRAYRSNLQGALIFSATLLRGTALHWCRDDTHSISDFDCSLASSHAERSSRRRLMGDKAWKRSGLITIFNTPFQAQECSYSVTLSSRMAGNWSDDGPIGWLGWRKKDSAAAAAEASEFPIGVDSADITVVFREDYIVSSVFGGETVRELALKAPFRALKLLPFVTIAIKTSSKEEIEQGITPPDIGLAYCGGGLIGETGMPWHIEGPFLQSPGVRHLPLPVCPDTSLGSMDDQDQQPSYMEIMSQKISRRGVDQYLKTPEIQLWNSCLILTALEILIPKTLRALHSTYKLSNRGNSPNRGTSVKKNFLESSAELQHFYKYWPYLSRMIPAVKHITKKSKMIEKLSLNPFFLSANGFQNISDVFLPILPLPKETIIYLQKYFPLAYLPSEIPKDFLKLKINFNPLKPSILREKMKKDVQQHCNVLKDNKGLLLSLLIYSCSDFHNEGENDTKGRKLKSSFDLSEGKDMYRDLAGCPLLPLSDGTVRSFPRNQLQNVIIAPPALHFLLPTLRNRMVHLTLLDSINISKNDVFRKALFISSFSTSFLEEVVAEILPLEWEKCAAIKILWNAKDPGSTGASDRQRSRGLSELLVYALWKDTLTLESKDALKGVKDWPLLPVVSKGMRMLVSPVYAVCVFESATTANQDIKRTQLKKDTDRVSSQALTAALATHTDALLPEHSTDMLPVYSSGWDWTARRGENPYPVPLPIDTPDVPTVTPTVTSTLAPNTAPASVSNPSHTVQSAADPVITHAPFTPLSNSFSTLSTDINDIDEGPYDAFFLTPSPAAIPTVAATRITPATTVTPVTIPDHNLSIPVAPYFDDGAVITPPNIDLLATMRKLGIPFLDYALLESPPVALVTAHRELYNTVGRAAQLGRKLLDCMYSLHKVMVTEENNLGSSLGIITPSLISTDSQVLATPLLNFTDITEAERSLILMEILLSNRSKPLTAESITQLKSLPLFSQWVKGRIQGPPIAISECESGVFWCDNNAVFEGIVYPSVTEDLLPPSQSHPIPPPPPTHTPGLPVILKYDPALQQLYDILEVLELTPALSVRNFTLPALNKMDGPHKLAAMLSIANRWSAYNDDSNLVATLKTVAFIPSWNSSIEGGSSSSSSIAAAAAAGAGSVSATASSGFQFPFMSSATSFASSGPILPPSSSSSSASSSSPLSYPDINSDDDVIEYRRADELLSWENKELYEALKGKQQSRYFCPPSIRSPELHLMLLALGQSSDLTGDYLLKVAREIEEAARGSGDPGSGSGIKGTGSASEIKGPGSVSEDFLSAARDRGRRLLVYMKHAESCSDLFKVRLCEKLRVISFIPTQLPVSIEHGGHVAYQPSLSRFDELLAFSAATVGFTVMPILDEDIAPPLIFFSSLAVTTSPTIEVVLRHLRNLTVNGGDSLDRWNNPHHSIKDTFSSLFRHLEDQWRSIVPPVRDAIRSSQIIPVGHMLVRPARLFFRLQGEDLSPFMHEVPRYFGAHEKFLKKLGVKEEPSAGDYVEFLCGLASECDDVSLNPNELRAVVAIVQAVATRAGEEQEGISSLGRGHEPLYLPDCDSFLRNSLDLLVNDDEWLSVRAKYGVRQAGLYLLHPNISLQVGAGLGVPTISGVLVEKLDLRRERIERSVGSMGDVGGDFADFHSDSAGGHNNIEMREGREGSMYPVRSGGPDSGEESDWNPLGTSGEAQLVDCIYSSLHSEEFVLALHALHLNKTIEGGRRNEIKGEGNPFEHSEFGVRCKDITLRFIDYLPVRLVLKDARRNGSELEINAENVLGGGAIHTRQSLFYIRYDASDDFMNTSSVSSKCTLFINKSMLAPPVTAEVAVSIGLCRLLSLDHSLATTVACLLSAPIGGKVSVLSALRVGSDPYSASVRESLRGIPGERVTDADRVLLELKPFRTFCQGEVVAFESLETLDLLTPRFKNQIQDPIQDPYETIGDFTPDFSAYDTANNTLSNTVNSTVYSTINNTVDFGADFADFDRLIPPTVPTGATGKENNTSRKQDTNRNNENNTNNNKNVISSGVCVRYARVVASGEAGDEGCGVQRVLLKTGNTSTQSMLSSEIFSFKAAREVAAKMKSDNINRMKSPQMSSASATATAASRNSNSGGARAGLNKPLTASNLESDPGSLPLKGLEPVNQEDLLEALNSLLTRVGLPPTLNEKSLLSKIVELENQNKQLSMKITTESALLNDAKQALSQSNNARKCPICTSGDVSHVMTPCGHVLCGSCVGQLPSNRCPFCRKIIQERIRFYLENEE